MKTAAYLCNVAGVSFNNPNGESRQEIIRQIINEKGQGNYYTGPAKLNITTYTDQLGAKEPAIEVWVENKLIGYIPRIHIETVALHPKCQSGTVLIQLSYIEKYQQVSGKIFTPNKGNPTKKMEFLVNKILHENKNLKKPDHSFEGYREFLNEHQGGKGGQLKTQYLQTKYECNGLL